MFHLPQSVAASVRTDLPVAIRLKYKGTGTVTSVTVTTATNIVAVTSDGGTDTYAFATYTTLGAVVDAINADGIFEAKILDALRSDASASKLVDGAITSSVVNGVTIWDAKVDTSTALHFSYRLTPSRLPGTLFPSRRVHLKLVKYIIDVGTAAADKVQFWIVRGKEESQVWSELSVKGGSGATPLDCSGSDTVGLTANPGEEIVVRVKDAATLADNTANWLQVLGLVEQSGLDS